ncbi:flavin-containing monooxygenase [Teichococcus vastitatis]|uniref:NAD(P)/FAD-dependent oxidoreductase n=1 Tax=Teichococcus vastitatis TaxID=2307076 RepID=A0ABS9W1X7_9PROT|nr:NAD(P)/FAD-dependent oxidoreductase [Pseudoroseomonas vastitatis]MCI0753053.1 NAD(P)/FAD-dependent oxidoreductase [Pseudoroseomonas vastitatis]
MSRADAARPATALLRDWVARFGTAIAAGDASAVAALFGAESYWRDLVAFTWTLHTSEGREAIRAMVARQAPLVQPGTVAPEGEAKVAADGTVEGWITFDTAAMRGRGYVRLRDGLCWILLTAGRELKGFEEHEGPTRERGAPLPGQHGAPSWLERRQEEAGRLGRSEQPEVLIVGGGQGGLGLAARLKRLRVPTLVIDLHDRPGDNWRKRYKSLCLHDPVWYDHMPYLPFPAHWPVFTPKDKLGDWLEMYAKVMELDCWNRTRCERATYDETEGRWTVVVDRDGEAVTLHPRQLVLATGMAGMPQMPSFPGTDSFRGEQHHSSQHAGGVAYRGKRVVVVGSNNSAHDICADVWAHGAEVTMVQRSSTLVVRTDTMLRRGWGALYSEEAVASGIDTEKADLLAASIPYRVQPALQRPLWEEIAREDAAFYDRLRAAGFLLDFGEDGTGLSQKYLRRGSGYYIDVGTSELIAEGRIGLARGAVEAVVPEGVRLSDGTILPADTIIYATGYGSMDEWAELLISRDVAEKVGRCWGLGSGTTRDPGPWQGELRNMWKPTAQPGLWFHGGNLAQSRHYSRYLALQLKARAEGLATPVYASPQHGE